MVEKEILNALVELLRSGGTMAVWALIAFQVMQIIKTSIGWIFVLWAIKIVTQTVTNLLKWSIDKDASGLEEIVRKAVEK